MKKYYDIGSGTLSRPVIEGALKRLAQLLGEQNKSGQCRVHRV
jgi:hypothetical protein